MPVSLGRRLRRIGIPPKVDRSEFWVPAKHTGEYHDKARELIIGAQKQRYAAALLQQEPSREHRRSKSRNKARHEKPVIIKNKK